MTALQKDKLNPVTFKTKEWGNLSKKLRNIDLLNMFKSSILNFVTPRENSVFAVHDINGLKLLTLVAWMNINFNIILMIQ